MDAHVCVTCGTQFTPSPEPPSGCPICLDERQYVGHDGQRWTTVAELAADHRNRTCEVEPGLLGIGTEPPFAIGQRALLVDGLLWDCVTLIDADTEAAVRAAGGVHTIAISHPHYYSAMVEWAQRLDARVLLHEADREHVMRPDPLLRFWEGESDAIGDGLTLIRCGGHFAGGTVLHWAGGADGRGALLSGDIVQVIPDRRYVSFMYSYPNLIPLPPSRIEAIAAALEPFSFDSIYGAWWDRVIERDGSGVVRRSADRYLRAIAEPGLTS